MSDDVTAAHPADTEQTSVRRWTRYGHDRLYVTAADGRKLGWYDLHADRAHPAAPGDAGRLDVAVGEWSSATARVTRPDVAGPPPPPDIYPSVAPSPATPRPPVAPPPAGSSDAVPPPVTAADHAEPQPHAGPAIPEPPAIADPCLPAPVPLTEPHGPQAFVGEPYLVKPSSSRRAATDPVPSPPPADQADLANRHAGAMARQQAVALKEAAPVRTFIARMVGARTEERAWRVGAVGEEKVAAQLEKLRARDPRWRFLHAVPVGERGSDIDHVAIGPAGVFTLNAKHHPGAKIWVAGNAFLVNGSRQPYVRNSRHEATRAGRLLSTACGFPVVVRGLIVPVRADVVTVKEQPDRVDVVARNRLARWLRQRAETTDEATVEEIFAHARRSTTWQP